MVILPHRYRRTRPLRLSPRLQLIGWPDANSRHIHAGPAADPTTADPHQESATIGQCRHTTSPESGPRSQDEVERDGLALGAIASLIIAAANEMVSAAGAGATGVPAATVKTVTGGAGAGAAIPEDTVLTKISLRGERVPVISPP